MSYLSVDCRPRGVNWEQHRWSGCSRRQHRHHRSVKIYRRQLQAQVPSCFDKCTRHRTLEPSITLIGRRCLAMCAWGISWKGILETRFTVTPGPYQSSRHTSIITATENVALGQCMAFRTLWEAWKHRHDVPTRANVVRIKLGRKHGSLLHAHQWRTRPEQLDREGATRWTRASDGRRNAA